jgi:ketosteroid isomerase-like protein
VPGPRRPGERVPGSQRVASTPVRIEVAKSGNLAYEFSDFVLSFETKTGERVSFPGSALRVWRKEGTAWKVAPAFMRPHYQEGAGAGTR